ncbi:hypothetical protein NP233_g11236 [Leucocoprinus birnbaumii]|uniref:DUF6570 domain-containing protein n=1 Tax=Leucocoprinus birnbaumii TaxID=56174 RepID=A0AAD5VHG5_9AGAR|nr:hypothetical protein NP233_g11236 [Leucocoprinus birnbaumii]
MYSLLHFCPHTALSKQPAFVTDSIPCVSPFVPEEDDDLIDDWKFDPALQSELDMIKPTHRVCPLPAFNENLNPIDPNEIQQAVLGSLVEVTFKLKHWTTNNYKTHNFAALISQIVILKRNFCLPLAPSPYKRICNKPVYHAALSQQGQAPIWTPDSRTPAGTPGSGDTNSIAPPLGAPIAVTSTLQGSITTPDEFVIDLPSPVAHMSTGSPASHSAGSATGAPTIMIAPGIAGAPPMTISSPHLTQDRNAGAAPIDQGVTGAGQLVQGFSSGTTAGAIPIIHVSNATGFSPTTIAGAAPVDPGVASPGQPRSIPVVSAGSIPVLNDLALVVNDSGIPLSLERGMPPVTNASSLCPAHPGTSANSHDLESRQVPPLPLVPGTGPSMPLPARVDTTGSPMTKALQLTKPCMLTFTLLVHAVPPIAPQTPNLEHTNPDPTSCNPAFDDLPDEICHHIYSLLCPLDIMTLKRVNCDHSLFACFTFRYLCGAIISGSFLLPLLTDADFEPRDLDVYVLKKHATTMINFFKGQGYKEETPDVALLSGYGSTFIEDIFYFTCNVAGCPTKKINLITTWTHNPLLSILDFDDTQVMNFLSPWYLACLYGCMTTSMFSVIACIPDTINLDCLTKYQSQGFNFLEYPLTKQDYDFLSSVHFADDYNVQLINYDVYERYYWVDEGLQNIIWRLSAAHGCNRDFIIDGKNGQGRFIGYTNGLGIDTYLCTDVIPTSKVFFPRWGGYCLLAAIAQLPHEEQDRVQNAARIKLATNNQVGEPLNPPVADIYGPDDPHLNYNYMDPPDPAMIRQCKKDFYMWTSNDALKTKLQQPHAAHFIQLGSIFYWPAVQNDDKGHVCHGCLHFLRCNWTPPLSLANNLFVGDVPFELELLTLAEKMLIAKNYVAAIIIKLFP